MENKDDKIMEGLVDKMMEGYDEEVEKDPNVQRVAARSGATTGKPETYQDWLKKQDKSGMPIGIKKIKKRK